MLRVQVADAGGRRGRCLQGCTGVLWRAAADLKAEHKAADLPLLHARQGGLTANVVCSMSGIEHLPLARMLDAGDPGC